MIWTSDSLGAEASETRMSALDSIGRVGAGSGGQRPVGREVRNARALSTRRQLSRSKTGPDPPADQLPGVDCEFASPAYFDAAGVPRLEEGRTPGPQVALD